MVAVIKMSTSINRILSYNENKVRKNVAICLVAGNMPLDPAQMNFDTKLACLKKVLELRPDIQLNSVHISLNFHPDETQLSDQKLALIAEEYMQQIGFGMQPYFVYRHHDAAHPHIHIVSIKVRPDGSRIDMQNIGKNQSRTACKSIEEKYGLIRADDHAQQALFKLKPVAAERVSYGRSETKNAIQNVLENVLDSYRYTSLKELNAVLRLYNIEAFQGEDNSRLKAHRGLLYRVLDSQGKPVGVPIKASSFYNNPGLKFLEERYGPNSTKRKPHAVKLCNTVDRLLLDKNISIGQLVAELEKQGISVVLRKNAEEIVYGITYVDHRNKTVFNGSDLGKAYSAKGLLERCGTDTSSHKATQTNIRPSAQHQYPASRDNRILFDPSPPATNHPAGSLLDILMRPEFIEPQNGHLRPKKRRKKRRKGNNNNSPQNI